MSVWAGWEMPGVFWRTGSYNFDIAAFSQKFIQDIVDAQTGKGAFTNVSPNTLPSSADASEERFGAKRRHESARRAGATRE